MTHSPRQIMMTPPPSIGDLHSSFMTEIMSPLCSNYSQSCQYVPSAGHIAHMAK